MVELLSLKTCLRVETRTITSGVNVSCARGEDGGWVLSLSGRRKEGKNAVAELGGSIGEAA